MQEASGSTLWAVLLPVIAGGVLAVLGGVVGPLMSHLLTAKESRRERRQQLFMQVMDLVQEHDRQTELRRLNEAFGETNEIGPPTLPKAVILVAVYFPDLRQDIRRVELESARYSGWISNAAQKRLRNEISSINEGHQERYRQYFAALQAFQDAAAEYAISTRLVA